MRYVNGRMWDVKIVYLQHPGILKLEEVKSPYVMRKMQISWVQKGTLGHTACQGKRHK